MKKLMFSLLIFALLLVSLALASAQDYGCGMMQGFAGSYGTGMMLFSWLFGLLVLVALVLFIVWLIKQIQKK